MTPETQQQHLHNILITVSKVTLSLADISMEQFKSSDKMKQLVYEDFQRIGVSADQLLMSPKGLEDIEAQIRLLSNLKGLAHNRDVDVDNEIIWNIVKNDLPTITNRIERSKNFEFSH